MDTKRAVLVARVSTKRQARLGLSIETQLEKCREYAERSGFMVVEELKSGASPAQQFVALLGS